MRQHHVAGDRQAEARPAVLARGLLRRAGRTARNTFARYASGMPGPSSSIADLHHLVLLLHARSRSSSRSGRHCRPGCPGSGGRRSAAAAGSMRRSMPISSATPLALGALPHALEQRPQHRSARPPRDPRHGRSRDSPRPAWTSRPRRRASPPAPGSSSAPISSSSSRIRVSGVRRSWLTAASISVRWPMWRRMRCAHQVEGVGRLANLDGAARPEIADVAPLAEAVGGAQRAGGSGGSAGAGNRSAIAASSTERADHPGQQEPCRRAGHPLARRQSPSAGRRRSGHRRRSARDRRCREVDREGMAQPLLRRPPGSCRRCGRDIAVDAGDGQRGLELAARARR